MFIRHMYSFLSLFSLYSYRKFFVMVQFLFSVNLIIYTSFIQLYQFFPFIFV